MELVQQYKDIITILALIVITLVLLYKFWEKIKFWWLNVTYSFPVIGKISKLSKNYQVQENGLFLSEKQLCNDYLIHYNKFQKDGNLYSTAQDYLDLLGEKKRKPMTMIVWIFIIGLVVVEALGFAYVLSGYAVPGASEDVKQYGAYGIGALISVILVYLTHQTGHILYENSVIKKINVWWVKDKNNPNRPSLQPTDGIGLENHHDDKQDPIYLRYLSRVPTNAEVKASLVVPIITAIFIVFVAIGSTYVRGEVMAQEMIEEKAANSSSSSVNANVWGDIPSALQKDQAIADNKAATESQEHFEKGAWGAFIVLAIIFVFLQIFGILLGFNRGFAGEDSDVAFHTVNGFSSREEFEHYHDHKKQLIAKTAQAKLQSLQQKMISILESGVIDGVTEHRPSVTFESYFLISKNDKLNATRMSKDLDGAHARNEEERETAKHEAKMQQLRAQKKRQEEVKALEEEIAKGTNENI